ncbi:MAG: YbaK/EbsC family protein [Methylobacteriaceae bacterium]|nr:YbaK/EbsC family protein [Methylobacteriaceae bacterium]
MSGSPPAAADDLPAAARRVAAAAAAAGLAIEVRVMPQSTRTAQEAAAACGCAVAQIVKSLIFRGAASGRPYLLLVSGANRVDEAKAAARLGEALTRPDAAYVRETTGYAIGGVPPLGHAAPMTSFIDETLLRYDIVWAAAGTPLAVFSADPRALQHAVGATIIAV